MAISNSEGTLVTKDFLSTVITAVKPLLNPISTEVSANTFFKLQLNPDIAWSMPIEVKLSGANSTNTKQTIFNGYIGNSGCVGRNFGTIRVSKVGLGQNHDIYVILTENTTSLRSEVFSKDDNYNLITSITSIDDLKGYNTPEEYLESIGVLVFTIVDSDPALFTFDVVDAEGNTYEVPTQTAEINSIHEAGVLHDDVDIEVTDKSGLLSGTGNMPAGTTNASIELEVNDNVFNNKVINIVDQRSIPAATESRLGGIQLIGSHTSGLTSNQFPVELTTDGNHRAYVEVPLGDMDIHRYVDLSTIPNPKVGQIVQYIGETNSNYTNGYFYKYIPSTYNVQLTSDGSTESNIWIWTQSRSATGQAIAQYNALKEYIFTTGLITVTPIIVLDPEHLGSHIFNYNISQNNVIQDTLNYESLTSLLGVRLLNPEDYNPEESEIPESLIIVLSEVEGQASWVQKNVQPAISVDNPLVYKGVCTWAKLEQATLAANPGEFWTISDKANQEYFFTGVGNTWEEKWEFMGDVFTVDGSLTVKVNNGTTTTVTEFSADGNSEEVTFTQGNHIIVTPDSNNHTITIAHADTSSQPSVTNHGRTYIQSIQLDTDGHVTGLVSATETVTNIKPNWNADSSADNGILNKPTLATVATTGNYNDLTNKPTIPSVGSGTLTVQRNGASLGTFNANASSNSTINIQVPTKISELTNDSNFINSNSMSTYIPVGTIWMWGGNIPDGNVTGPDGWLVCNGSRIKKDNYPNLYNAIQSIYGSSGYIYSAIFDKQVHYIKTVDSSQNVTSITDDIREAEFFPDDSKQFLYRNVTFKSSGHYFVLPDFRLKFPLGAQPSSGTGNLPKWDCGGQSWDTRLGQVGGENEHTLTKGEMPRHSHELNQELSPYTAGTNQTTPYSYNQTHGFTSEPEVYTLKTKESGMSQSHNNIPPFLAVNFIIKY